MLHISGAKDNSLKKDRIYKEVRTARRSSKHGKRRVSNTLLSKIRQARYLLCLLCSLVVADAVISNFIVRSGLGTEGNPFIQSIVGQTSFVFLKISAAFLSSLILWKIFKQHHRLGLVNIVLFVALYTAIIWWNLGIWFVGQHNVYV